jgi:hypothetical protein
VWMGHVYVATVTGEPERLSGVLGQWSDLPSPFRSMRQATRPLLLPKECMTREMPTGTFASSHWQNSTRAPVPAKSLSHYAQSTLDNGHAPLRELCDDYRTTVTLLAQPSRAEHPMHPPGRNPGCVEQRPLNTPTSSARLSGYRYHRLDVLSPKGRRLLDNHIQRPSIRRFSLGSEMEVGPRTRLLVVVDFCSKPSIPALPPI